VNKERKLGIILICIICIFAVGSTIIALSNITYPVFPFWPLFGGPSLPLPNPMVTGLVVLLDISIFVALYRLYKALHKNSST